MRVKVSSNISQCIFFLPIVLILYSAVLELMKFFFIVQKKDYTKHSASPNTIKNHVVFNSFIYLVSFIYYGSLTYLLKFWKVKINARSIQPPLGCFITIGNNTQACHLTNFTDLEYEIANGYSLKIHSYVQICRLFFIH